VNAEIDYFEHTEMGGLDWQRNGRGVREKGYTTELLGNEALEWLSRRDRSKPFFLYMPFNAVHAPLQAPPEALARFAHIENPRRRAYAAMTDIMDAQIGRVLDRLDSEGSAADTLVIFLSDNGGATGAGADNGSFRAGKLSCYEGGLRVPAAMRWPGRIPAGRVITDWMTVLDMFPTLCSALGITAVGGQPLDGVNMWPVITGSGKAAERNFFVACKRNEVSHFQYGLRTAEWKLVETIDPQQKKTLELFHLRDDAEEKNNVARASLRCWPASPPNWKSGRSCIRNQAWIAR
jgi:arylsulfatase A-like enzyme